MSAPANQPQQMAAVAAARGQQVVGGSGGGPEPDLESAASAVDLQRVHAARNDWWRGAVGGDGDDPALHAVVADDRVDRAAPGGSGGWGEVKRAVCTGRAAEHVVRAVRPFRERDGETRPRRY